MSEQSTMPTALSHTEFVARLREDAAWFERRARSGPVLRTRDLSRAALYLAVADDLDREASACPTRRPDRD